jgi:hypothetical protein
MNSLNHIIPKKFSLVSRKIIHKYVHEISVGTFYLYKNINLLISYFLNAVILISCVSVIGQYTSPQSLQSFLVYFFIASTAAGLEPGTSKAALAFAPNENLEKGMPLLFASSSKALLITLPMVVIWIFSAHTNVNATELVWAPVIVILGFLATDLRVALDASGQHTFAIWCKQGSLALAAVVPATALLLNYNLSTGIAVSCVARVAWTAVFWLITKGSTHSAVTVKQHFFKRPWGHFLFASCLGAISASIDRIIAIRFLAPGDAGLYIMIYEVMTKFWVINYLLAPLVFTEKIKSSVKNRISGISYILIGILGIIFLSISLLFSFFDIIDWPINNLSFYALPAFTLAIVIAAWNGIITAELQALNRARHVSRSVAAGLVVSVVAFPTLLMLWGINGLFLAWIAKSIIEFGFLLSARKDIKLT